MRPSILLIFLAASFMILSPGVMAEEKKKKEEEKVRYEIDEANLYLGDPSDFTKPAVVDATAVYNKIPEYRKIVERDMDETNPRYLFLMRAASEKFLAALEAVSEGEGYDLIGEIGSIKVKSKGKGKKKPKIPDITAKVIKKLPE